ncbi:HAMP domain-containing histidine kinase [Solibacillus sp. MA9]|uniref:Heme sensor protein HssS n=1 Tax=Solibacillus palustris TaxID=2908203 RepID=A0ABS9UG95_9BACL|nr:HAMP domain-containing sensor histidine kinase [Solibacillus sp. MA9]MCH7323373.1 HAMP domain-containing histidine kinase [Solibacillus sp. MA9]
MKTLYTKFVVTTIVIMIFSSLTAFFISNLYYQSSLKPKNDAKTTELAVEMVQYIEKHPELPLANYLQHSAATGYHIMLIDSKNNTKMFGEPFRDTALDQTTIDKVLNGEIFHGIAEFPQQTFVTGFFANELKNSIGVPLHYANETYAFFLRPNVKIAFNEMHYLFAALIIFTILLSIILVLLSTKFIVQPIKKLKAATSSIADGNYKIQLDHRNDELGQLSESFMQMAKKLSYVDEKRKEFISNISHDIQSPLSNIKGFMTLIENEHTIKEQYALSINAEINRLSTLTNQLLQLTTLDQQERTVKFKNYSLDEQLQKLIHQYQWQFQQKDLMASYSLPATTIYGDSELLSMVWDNLLSNAIKYTNEFGMIGIQLQQDSDAISVIFHDNGIGIPEQEQQRIFERFYRVDSARTRTIEGTGLGLAIAQQIVQLHNGTIDVVSTTGAGTTITVTIPQNDANDYL